MVKNAASFDAEDPAAVGSADWSGLLDLKLIGYWRVVQAVVPAMSGRGGAVTNVAGMAGVHASPMVRMWVPPMRRSSAHLSRGPSLWPRPEFE